MRLVNLTPDPIKLQCVKEYDDGTAGPSVMTIPPDGRVARVGDNGSIEGLPGPDGDADYIVSMAVLEAMRRLQMPRRDVVSPDPARASTDGSIRGFLTVQEKVRR